MNQPSADLAHGFGFNAIEYLELFKEMITKKAKPGDNFMLELRSNMDTTALGTEYMWIEINILYSRYYRGGPYEGMCSVNFYRGILEVYQYSKYDYNAKESDYVVSFDIASPDCFDKVVDIVIKTADIMQLDRSWPEQLELPNVWERKNQ